MEEEAILWVNRSVAWGYFWLGRIKRWTPPISGTSRMIFSKRTLPTNPVVPVISTCLPASAERVFDGYSFALVILPCSYPVGLSRLSVTVGSVLEPECHSVKSARYY